MDKETLSNYGWIVICVLVLAVMLALATPFGQFVADGFKATYTGLFQTGDNALDVGLNAVGVSNKLPCGHGRKEAGDHTQKECGHYNCQNTECGCVPATCGIEGHWSNDGKDHTTKVNHTGHTYACQCSGWIVPEGGTYTMKTAINDKSVYTAGEQLPCGYTTNSNDKYEYGDYRYYCQVGDGWRVYINTDVTDKNKETYGQILDEINGKYVTSLEATFSGCTNLKTAPAIPSHVKNMHTTFYNCSSLTIAPDMSNAISVTSMYGTFINCTALTNAPIIPSSVKDMAQTFQKCSSLITPPDMSDAVNVTKMSSAFYGCHSLTGVPNLSNCIKLTSLGQAFWDCTSLVDASNLSIPNSVTNLEQTFLDCSALTVAPAIPSSVTNMKATFSGCKSLITAPDMSNATGVTNMTQTFSNCTKLSIAPDLSKCINLENVQSTFWCCYSLEDTIKLPCKLINASKGWVNCKAPIEYICTVDNSVVADIETHSHG